ncbi:MAG: DUF6541 family protein [Chloroflexota bacterium]
MQDPEASQEYRADVVATLGNASDRVGSDAQPGQTVGQVFVSQRPRLNGVQLWLRPASSTFDPTATLTVELYPAPGASSPLASQQFTYAEIDENFPISVHFPVQDSRDNRPYFLRLQADGALLRIYGRNQDSYPKGQLWVDQTPQNADLSFRLSYDYGLLAFLNDLARFLAGSWLILPFLLILWLPGRLLLGIWWARLPDKSSLPFDWGQRLALSIGLSLAVIPLILLWTTRLGLHWNLTGLVIAALLLVALYLWQNRSHLSGWPRRRLTLHPDLVNLGLALVFILSLGVRLIMVRDLATPAWVDPVHHALITRTIMEAGAFPETYQPYLPSTSASYHAGLHASLAAFTALTSLPLQRSLLIFGQVLNALSVFAVYLLAAHLTRDRKAALLAAWLAGLFTPMPAYYTSWGRYTQLAGLLILPAGVLLIDYLLSDSKTSEPALLPRPPALALAGLALGGLWLTHYRVAAFLACLVLADRVTRFVRDWWRGSYWKTAISHLVLWSGLGGLALLLTLPWWPAALGQLFTPVFANWNPTTPNHLPLFSDFTWSYLTAGLGKITLILAAFGLRLAQNQGRRFFLTIFLWIVLLFSSANLGFLRLPGQGLITNASVEIALFLPISILGGYLLAGIINTADLITPPGWHKLAYAALAALAIAASWHAGSVMLPVLNPVTLLSRQADLTAIQWLDQHLPPGEPVLINAFSWGYGTYAGNDGGYWIGPLAGHPTIPPAVLFSLSNTPEEAARLRAQSRQAFDASSDPEALLAFLKSQGVHYVFSGVRGGPLSPSALRASPFFQILYNQDGVWLFQVR